MADYSLDRDEAVIMKEMLAGYGPPAMNLSSFELVLTNRKLVVIRRGMRRSGPALEVRTFPINQIRLFNGQPQVMLRDRNAVEIYFPNGPESFRFHLNAVAVRLVDQVNLLATGRESEVVVDNDVLTSSSPDYLRAMRQESFEAFRGRPGAKPQAPQPVPKATAKCMGCGARIDGFEGRWATCAYCGNQQQLGAPAQSQPVPPQPAPGLAAPARPAPPAAPRPPAPPPAGWKPDPKRAHELRWWDGRAWTPHVSDRGVPKYDPL